MNESSKSGHGARVLLHRVLMGIVARIEVDLRRIHDFPEGGIHSLRRRLKKLGSILKLARKHISGRSKQRIRQHIRLLKDAFAAARDAEVMRRLAKRLGIPQDAVRRPGKPRNRKLKADAAHLKAAARLRELIGALPLDDVTWKTIASAFLHAWKKERDAWEAACDDTTAEMLHEWRKQAKALNYQMLCVHKITGRMRKPIKLVERLGHWLGKHHDLDVLASQLKRSVRTERCVKKTAQRQTELRHRIFRAADRLHDRKPARSAKSLAATMASAARG